jgi:hypothetical protein
VTIIKGQNIMTDEARETFGHFIDVTLTEEEITAKLNRNADIDREILSIMGEKAAANSGFNADLKTLRKEQVTLLEAAKAGKAKLEIQCYNDRDDRRGMMLVRRKDNGEIVDERALTAEEREADRQGNLFEGPAPDADAPTPDQEEEEGGDTDAEAKLDEYLASGGAVGDDADPLGDDADQPVVN